MNMNGQGIVLSEKSINMINNSMMPGIGGLFAPRMYDMYLAFRTEHGKVEYDDPEAYAEQILSNYATIYDEIINRYDNGDEIWVKYFGGDEGTIDNSEIYCDELGGMYRKLTKEEVLDELERSYKTSVANFNYNYNSEREMVIQDKMKDAKKEKKPYSGVMTISIPVKSLVNPFEKMMKIAEQFRNQYSLNRINALENVINHRYSILSVIDTTVKRDV